jgi:deoxycytidylate deaminase
MESASDIASIDSFCLRWHCGAVVVAQDGVIIGEGANVTPDRKLVTSCIKNIVAPDFKSDKHCCIHAEQAAIDDALASHAEQVPGSTIYFVKHRVRQIVKHGIRQYCTGKRVPSGKPWCTQCSKLALHAGLAEFVLWHADGIYAYPTLEYNDLSFKFTEAQPKAPAADPPCPYARQLCLFPC